MAVLQTTRGGGGGSGFVDLHWRVDVDGDVLGHSECAVMETFARRAGWRAAAVVGDEDAGDASATKKGGKRARPSAVSTSAKAAAKAATTRTHLVTLLRRVDVAVDDPARAANAAAAAGNGNAGGGGAGKRPRDADIVAVVPASEKALLGVASGAVHCDLVRIDLVRPLGFRLRPAVLDRVVARGIFFEICYAEALRGAAARRQLFANAKALVAAARGARGIVVSSGARTANELRSPHDVANLATLFGIGDEDARRAVGHNARECLHRARRRKDESK